MIDGGIANIEVRFARDETAGSRDSDWLGQVPTWSRASPEVFEMSLGSATGRFRMVFRVFWCSPSARYSIGAVTPVGGPR